MEDPGPECYACMADGFFDEYDPFNDSLWDRLEDEEESEE